MPNRRLKLLALALSLTLVGTLAAFLFFNFGNTNIGGPEKLGGSIIKALPERNILNSLNKYFYFLTNNKAATKEPKVSAEAYVVGDLDTGEVILSKNENKAFPIASVSKLMTALVATKLNSKNETATVSARALATYGENGNFKRGEKISISDLRYPLLLESSNDAAEIIAEHFDRETFIRKMNEQAKALNMEGTSFSDPSGLSEKNRSTVADLFRLTGYVRSSYPEIITITTLKKYSNKKHTWYNTSQFLRDLGYLGGKSGFISEAKQTGVSLFSLPLAKSESRPVGITLLRSNDRTKDVRSLVSYLRKNVYYGGEKDAKSDWVLAKLDQADISEPDFVTFAFMGDIMLDRGVRQSVTKNFNGDYSALFEKLDLLHGKDIVFANLEGPASDKGKDLHNLYSFRMDPSVIPALKGAGFTILSVANNHVGDWTRIAYIDTLSRLKENELLYAGGGINKEEAENPTIIEKNGMTIGFLGFSDKGPDDLAVADDKTGLLIASNPRFEEIIKNAAAKVDYLIVSFHFGEEYQTKHDKRQEELAHKAIDNGAKIVIGAHPHVVQDTEVYKNGFIAYSLGNFIFDQKFSAGTMEGMLLEMRLTKDGSMTIKKDTVKLNSYFRPDKIIFGKEEKVNFKTISR